MGGLIAFEIARHVKRFNLPPPKHLFISSRSAPHHAIKKPYKYLMTDDELIEEISSMGGTPNEVLEDRKLVQVFLPIIRSDFKIAETYQSGSGDKIDCALTVFYGDDEEFIGDPKEWEQYTLDTFSAYGFPGVK